MWTNAGFVFCTTVLGGCVTGYVVAFILRGEIRLAIRYALNEIRGELAAAEDTRASSSIGDVDNAVERKCDACLDMGVVMVETGGILKPSYCVCSAGYAKAREMGQLMLEIGPTVPRAPVLEFDATEEGSDDLKPKG